jgi:predicted component of type VI protein secretion system
MKDAASCFRLTLGPLSIEQARTFLPGATSHGTLREIVSLYAPAYLDFEIHLTLRAGEAPPAVLGAVTSPLGWLCWLGQPAPVQLGVSLGRFSG